MRAIFCKINNKNIKKKSAFKEATTKNLFLFKDEFKSQFMQEKSKKYYVKSKRMTMMKIKRQKKIYKEGRKRTGKERSFHAKFRA